MNFNITECFIKRNPVYKAVICEETVAFWGMEQKEGSWELEYFYIAMRHMGKGYGKSMWFHLTDWCEKLGIFDFTFCI